MSGNVIVVEQGAWWRTIGDDSARSTTAIPTRPGERRQTDKGNGKVIRVPAARGRMEPMPERSRRIG